MINREKSDSARSAVTIKMKLSAGNNSRSSLATRPRSKPPGGAKNFRTNSVTESKNQAVESSFNESPQDLKEAVRIKNHFCSSASITNNS
jgi:hypothetical protein